MKILLAEDDATLRETWAAALQAAKFDVEQSQGTGETLYRFCMQTPDLTILSLNAPATEMLRLISSMTQFHPGCPLVLLAADLEPYRDAVRPELDLLVKKPIELSQLLEPIKNLLARLKPELSPQGPEPSEPPFVMSPRGGGRHYRKKTNLEPKIA